MSEVDHEFTKFSKRNCKQLKEEMYEIDIVIEFFLEQNTLDFIVANVQRIFGATWNNFKNNLNIIFAESAAIYTSS